MCMCVWVLCMFGMLYESISATVASALYLIHCMEKRPGLRLLRPVDMMVPLTAAAEYDLRLFIY